MSQLNLTQLFKTGQRNMNSKVYVRTLEDLPDATEKPRAELPIVIAEGEALRKQIATAREELAQAQSRLADAEGKTAQLEERMRKASEKSRLVTAAEYGAHIATLADLRVALATVTEKSNVLIPELEDRLASTNGYIEAIQKSIKLNIARNALSLYEARLIDANLLSVSEYVRSTLFDAGINLHDSRACPILLDQQASKKVGPFTLSTSSRHESFANFYKPKPVAPEPPIDESIFNGMWEGIKK